jgi:hypothetical protein
MYSHKCFIEREMNFKGALIPMPATNIFTVHSRCIERFDVYTNIEGVGVVLCERGVECPDQGYYTIAQVNWFPIPILITGLEKI